MASSGRAMTRPLFSKAHGLCQFGAALGLANYILFAVGTNLLGDAINGHTSGLRYFVQAGGGFIEVSRFAFRFTEFQSYSLLVTFPVALLCAYLLSPSAPTDDPLDADMTRSAPMRGAH